MREVAAGVDGRAFAAKRKAAEAAFIR